MTSLGGLIYGLVAPRTGAWIETGQMLVGSEPLVGRTPVNPMAVAEYVRRNGQEPNFYLHQSFMAAAKAFKAIDAPTRGIIVPYGEAGRRVIADLCAAFLPDKDFTQLRLAQQFTVNVFPHVRDRLMRTGAVEEILEGTGILFLDSRYYSREFGLSETPVEEMEVLNA